MSVPRYVGQLPVYYNKPAPLSHDYVEMSAQPLYPFGFGLSYTTFEYSGLTVKKHNDGSCDVSFTVTNTGTRQGDEVTQLYMRHRNASVVQPERQLKAFQRITLEPGESRQVTLHLDREAFAIVDGNMNWVVEPGTVDIMIGASSTDIRLTRQVAMP